MKGEYLAPAWACSPSCSSRRRSHGQVRRTSSDPRHHAMKKIAPARARAVSPPRLRRPAGRRVRRAAPPVDIGGRKLNLFCSGTGSPTVVFESPSGGAGWHWWAVQPTVGREDARLRLRSRRLRLQRSVAARGRRRDAVDDLHALLQAAGVAPPYVLVGNSFGGGGVELFAWQHPAEVAGLVLVEPCTRTRTCAPDALTHGAIPMRARDPRVRRRLRARRPPRASTRSLKPTTTASVASIPRSRPRRRRRPEAAPGARVVARAPSRATGDPRRSRPAARRPQAVRRPARDRAGARRQPVPDPGQAAERHQQGDRGREPGVADRGRARLDARRSARVAGAGHEIQETHPEAVVIAVDDVLAQVRR